MLYYLKIRGFYIKEDSIVPNQRGRRKKYTFSELVEAEKDFNRGEEDKKIGIDFHKLFDIVDVDSDYEEKQDELERIELIRRENEIDDEQTTLF